MLCIDAEVTEIVFADITTSVSAHVVAARTQTALPDEQYGEKPRSYSQQDRDRTPCSKGLRWWELGLGMVWSVLR